jgi:hypothetical protein
MMTMKTMVQKGDAVPHFAVTRLDGSAVEYGTIWQNRDLVLLALPAGDQGAEYASGVADRMSRFDGAPAECVITRTAIPGLPAPGAIVADRWGEIYFVAAADRVDGLPSPGELVDWLRYVQMKCPECEGEAR